jgi:hypothetical protein
MNEQIANQFSLSILFVPYIIFSAAIAAVVLGIRTAFPYLKTQKVISTMLPLVLGAIGGWLLSDLHPKGTTETFRALYGLLAGSFSPPIYHACRRLVAAKLKGNSPKPNAGFETTFDTSDQLLETVKKPEQ